MKLLGLFLLIILNIYLICDDRKRYAELRKYKKMMRQSRREARKEFWQKMRTRLAKPRNEEPDSGAVLKETKQRYQNVVLDFSFPEYRQENLDFINKTLSRYALKDVTVTDHSGALVKDENGIGLYALKRCTLSCDLMPSGPGLDFQISTMAASKTVQDCGLLWQQKNPGRKLCRKVFRHLGNAYALVVVHHDRATHLPQREIIPRDRKPEGPFTLEYHFRNRLETDLDQINADLARYELSELKLVDFKGYLATETKTDAQTGEKTVRYWYGLDDCILRCTPAKYGERYRYRIDTMTVDKTLQDGGACWRQANPDRAMRTKVELSFDVMDAIIVLHHKKPEPAAVPVQAPVTPKKTAPVPVPMLPKPAPPVHFDSKTQYCCGRPGKDTLTFRYENATLYIEGQGRLRCGQWPWLTAPIRHVVIGPGCTAIGDFVFLHCRALETVVLPDTLRTIGERAFAYCTGLREVMIPDSVTGIGKGAFMGCKSLARVHLPRNLSQIHPDTFRDCENLQDVQIPDSVHYIGARAFYRVKSVKNLPRNLGNWGTKTPLYSTRRYGLGKEAFAYAGLPEHIEIPDRIDTLPERVFRECKTLVSVTLPRGLREIGEGAFGWCSSLTGITLPESVMKIGEHAFLDCTSLTDITLPEGITEIGTYAFTNCKSLISLKLPDSVTKLGAGAFAGTGIVHAVLPEHMGRIPDKLFFKCQALRSAVLPDGITVIGVSAFDGCGALEEIRIPDRVTSIERRAFHSCVKLASLKLPESLISLGSAAFACCSGLTEMVIPSGLTYIPQSAFASCTGLTSVTIPDSVTQIAIWGFTGCTALKDLYIPSTVTFIGTSAFTDVPGIIYHGPLEGLNNWGALSRNGIPTERKRVTINEILWEHNRCNNHTERR